MEHAPGVMRVRRTYNQWVGNETLEDFALRFTARRARKWSAGRVANTAIGSISFLALEAIGGALTLSYGFDNAFAAILTVGAILFLTGLPISYHAAKAGVDVDLLTRGAGFGYIGSTVTSLIYASFTFIFFALEAAILSQALELCFGVPLWAGYLLNALVVIPLVTHGFARIGEFQKWTQPFWVVLHLTPFLVLAAQGAPLAPWLSHAGRLGDPAGGVDLVLFAAASGVVFSLVAQIGEQVDFLRFLPEPRTRGERLRWWGALLAAGPGWAVLGTAKMLAGSFLAVLILGAGTPAQEAIEPTKMYLAAFERFAAPEAALLLTGLFVVLSQLKINVTNAYAGSIAWSNFFSRLTHSHPGRVVWLVFNVAIALMLMQFGVFGALERTLALYGHVAVAWIGALTADLVVNKPLGLAPRGIEFRRAHLYDVNPVGVGAMGLATVVSLAAYLGPFGATAEALSSFLALGVAFVAAPAIALATRGRYYVARPRPPEPASGEAECMICEHRFDAPDMAHCPFHGGAICSLCCSLEARCADMCKPHATIERQAGDFADRWLPAEVAAFFRSRYGLFAMVAGAFTALIGLMLLMIQQQASLSTPEAAEPVGRALLLAFGLLVVIVGVAAWLHTLAHESRVLATKERERQTALLRAEIRAHERTDAELQRAKEVAEAANDAKSRYVVGISHELRTPLNAILGYAQLLENDPTLPAHRRQGVKVIRRSSEHLADLIEGLLDISKIEAGRLEVYRDATPLRELIDQMAAVCRMEADEKRLRFALEVSETVPERVWADARRLRQILMNLLSNAVRYTDAGEVRFVVGYRNEIATFEVRDTGRGVAPEDRIRIFEPFERIQRADAPVRGTGLGLTITKLLVDMLGGDLRLTSEVGRGSTFTVRLLLPRITGEAPAAETARRVYGYRGPRRRLLIVEDNPEHRNLLEDALRPLGFDLTLAESGEAALAMLDAAPCDLALVDVAMPGMSGWELAAALRETRGFGGPVVMISAHAADQRRNQRPHAGPNDHHDDFLAKPVRIEELLARLGRHLRLDWVTEEPVEGPRAAVRAAPEALDALAANLSIGHVRGFEKALDRVDRSDPAAAAFVAEARRRLDSLDLAGLEALIAEARQ
jgi:signal transduction histidine kinase/CheY-like chemotaxis protein